MSACCAVMAAQAERGCHVCVLCSLQMGVCKRLWLTESFMPSWKFIVRALPITGL